MQFEEQPRRDLCGRSSRNLTVWQEEDNLREEVRISAMVGSHNNIVYMKEFVENKDKYFIILEYLTGASARNYARSVG